MNTKHIEKIIPNYLLYSNSYFLVITNFEGEYMYVNEAFQNRFSFINENLIGLSYLLTTIPEDHLIYSNAIHQCFTNPDSIVKINLRKPDTNPEHYSWISWEFSTFKDENQNPIGILCLGHDTTEAEKANLQAKKFAEKVDIIIEEMNDGFYQLDREWRFSKINHVAEKVLGIDRTQLLGKYFWDLFPDSTQYNYPLYFRKAMNENQIVSFEDYYIKLNKWFHAIAYPLTEGINVFFKDITDNHKNRIELQESQLKLKAILDSTRDNNLLISLDYKILNYNKAAHTNTLKIVGKELFIGGDIRDFLPQDSKAQFEICFSKALNGETHIIEVERNINNQSVWFEVTYLPVFDDENIQIGVSINHKNINDKKQAELRVKEQKLMLKAIYNSTTEAVIFINTDFIIRFFNQSAKYLIKLLLNKEIQIGDNSLDYALPEYRTTYKNACTKVLLGETIITEQAGYNSWWRLAMYPVQDESQNIIGIAHNVQNITAQKEKEFKIIKQNEALKAISWQQSHELRKPVANILGLCDLLQNYSDGSEELKIQYIEGLLLSTKELDSIIHKIVKLSTENQ